MRKPYVPRPRAKKYVKHHVFPVGPVLALAMFPWAQSETLAEAPDHCDRCTTGFWRLCADGLQCRGCSRHWLVGEMLRELVGKPLEHDVPHHRIPAPSWKSPS